MTTVYESAANDTAPAAGPPRRPGIRPPKFAGKFAALDFEAEPLPVIALFAAPAPIALAELTLNVRGDDLAPRVLGWNVLRDLPAIDLVAPLVCQIFNWHEVVCWRGVRLADVLAAAGVAAHPEGFYAVSSRDGHYFETLSRAEADDPRVLLAFGLNGGPLPHEYGGPLRLVVPFLQGYKSVKWVGGVQAFRHDPHGIKRLLGQSKSAELGQAWRERLGIAPASTPQHAP